MLLEAKYVLACELSLSHSYKWIDRLTLALRERSSHDCVCEQQ
jgi:hypothetical protein